MLGLRGLKSGVGHISSWPQDSSKIQKIGHFGAKNLPKPIANISVRFERKKIWPKKHFSKNPKISASEAPGPKGGCQTTGAIFVKIGLGPSRVLRASYVQSLF